MPFNNSVSERDNDMMAVDTALQQREAEGDPIRVGMIGAGATGRAIALQLGTPVPGMRLVAIANRTPEHSETGTSARGVSEKWSRVEVGRAKPKPRSTVDCRC